MDQPDPLHGIAPPEVVEQIASIRVAIQRVTDQQESLLQQFTAKTGMRRPAELWQVLFAGAALCLTLGTVLNNYTSTTRDAIVQNAQNLIKTNSDVADTRRTVDQMLIDNRARDTTIQSGREDVSAIRADIRWLRDEWDRKGPANDRTQKN